MTIRGEARHHTHQVTMSRLHIDTVRRLLECNSQDRVCRLLGCNTSTVDKVLTTGRLTPPAAARLAAALDALLGSGNGAL